jgi:hypothetical protein
MSLSEIQDQATLQGIDATTDKPEQSEVADLESEGTTDLGPDSSETSVSDCGIVTTMGSTSSLSTELKELYDENITAKILRTAKNDLKDNVGLPRSDAISCSLAVCYSIWLLTLYLVTADSISRICTPDRTRSRQIHPSRGVLLDMWLLSWLHLFSHRTSSKASAQNVGKHVEATALN